MESCFKFSLFSKFPEISQGISNRADGNMSFYRGEQGKVIQNRQHFLKELGLNLAEVVMPEIVHGAKVIAVGLAEKGKGATAPDDIKGVDGLVTTARGLNLMVTAADCFPILAYDPLNHVIGIAHAGWRGIMAGIVTNLIHGLQMSGAEPPSLMIGVAPGICQRHFVIGRDVLKKFLGLYPMASLVRNKDGYVDLRKAIRSDLNEAGITHQNIEISQICPVCHNGVFGSHRLEQEKAPVSAAIIGLNTD
jgi:YfiH family protein